MSRSIFAAMAAPAASRAYLAEFVGTYLLVFLGPGAAVVDSLYGGLGAFGIGVVFGLVVWAMIRLLGSSSGAHINPAVTLAFAYSGDLRWNRVLPYMLAQCSGALAASYTHVVMWPQVERYGMTSFEGHWTYGFGLELGLTIVLMGSIYFAIHTEVRRKWVATIVGATVGLEAWLVGPYCGASMNPARSLGPAVASGDVSQLWVYLMATTLGALLVAAGVKARYGNLRLRST